MNTKLYLFIGSVFFTLIFFAGCQSGSGINKQEPPVVHWEKLGPGGGGATFIPTFSYKTPDNFLLRCDMTGSYLTRDGGASYQQINFAGGASSLTISQKNLPKAMSPAFSATSGKVGAPFSIKANNNQGVWVDILIPRDASAGTYKGNATVTLSEKVFVTIPISLEVYDFTLPDSTHIKNMFGYSPGALAQRHGVSNGSAAYYELEAKYLQMAHRHRFDLVTGVANLDDMTKYYKRYYTGEIYTAANSWLSFFPPTQPKINENITGSF